VVERKRKNSAVYRKGIPSDCLQKKKMTKARSPIQFFFSGGKKKGNRQGEEEVHKNLRKGSL